MLHVCPCVFENLTCLLFIVLHIVMVNCWSVILFCLLNTSGNRHYVIYPFVSVCWEDMDGVDEILRGGVGERFGSVSGLIFWICVTFSIYELSPAID